MTHHMHVGSSVSKRLSCQPVSTRLSCQPVSNRLSCQPGLTLTARVDSARAGSMLGRSCGATAPAHCCATAMPACRIPEATQAVATFLAKANGIIAGLAVVDMVCEAVDPTLQVGR